MNKFALRLVGACLVAAMSVGVLAGCGDKGDETERDRDGLPFLHVKLRSKAPRGSNKPPITAEVEGSKDGAPTQSHQAGPVEAGGEATSSPTGTQAADAVTITVHAGTMTFTGSGSYPGKEIESVEIEVGQQTNAATVKFHHGQPEQTIPLAQQ